MSEVEGKVLTCDVCGESVFLKYVMERKADGGYTSWREYEKPPAGWNTSDARTVRHTCPACSKHINAAIEAAIQSIQEVGE